MSYYIFFTGLPKNYPAQSIRDLFSRCGNVVSMKLSTRSSAAGGAPGRTITEAVTQSGLVEYPDEASQQAAIASFNGYSVETPRGAVRIRVGASSGMAGGERRGRAPGGASLGAGTGANAPANDAFSSGGFGRFVDSDLAYSESDIIAQHHMHGKNMNQGFGNNNNNNNNTYNNSSRRDPLQMSLRAAPPHELAEAVEQLRVMCLEQPEKARILLDTFPQLRRAVCMVLQKEGKLPIPLPPEAFVERKVLLQQQQQQQQEKLEQDAAAAAASHGNSVDEEEQQKISDIINELSADALQELLVADFDSQEGEMDETTRQHFMKIQRQLRAMAEES